MNYSTAIFLISDKARAVMVSYETDDNGKPASTTLFKTLNQEIKKGDYVVVETDTRHHMTVCRVEDVDVEPDFDSAKEVKWIIGTVSRADFDDLKAQEEDAITRIKKAEKRKKREELRASLLADAADEIKALPIYTHTEPERKKK